MVVQKEIDLPPFSKGIHLITNYIQKELESMPDTGILNIHLKHTSAALSLNENADPDVRYDMDTFLNKLVPENHPDYTHTLEGSDDMPAHIKSSLFGASLTVPVTNRKMNLGTWQGIYLCEFRRNGGSRALVMTLIS
jgi:secondary thiamine-phosphate synthase enzyme